MTKMTDEECGVPLKSGDLILEIVPEMSLEARLIKVEEHIISLWEALAQVYDDMPQEPEPEERDDRA